MPLLELVKINKNFGGVQALDDVSLTINKGEIYGLIGPNGAGKTTLFNVITGVYLPNNGGISFNQQSIVGRKPYQVALAGIARTFQNIRLFQNMTVMENVMVGMHANTSTGSFGAIFSTKSARHEEKMIREQSAKWLSYVGILTEANNLARNLSYGDQRRLEIARALATKPKLLALDEPAAGMNATETEELKLLIQRIRNDGISILLIEHDVKLIMNLCDRVAVLDFGQKIAEDVPQRVRTDPKVIQAYIGGELP
ncbi:MAG: ABC transporter ATP-binding protein [Burkholderiales bacterium]|nr:ABC transporter ATP-binding protein [Burkholderiales bacterium]